MIVSCFGTLFSQYPLIDSFHIYFGGDLKLMKSRQAAVLFLLMMLLLSAVPASLIFAAEGTDNDQTEDEAGTQSANNATAIKAQRMLEIANRTVTCIEQLIERILTNETILSALENASLLDDFNETVSRFNETKSLLGEALAAIESGDYESALEIISEAMGIFREVYKAIYKMTEKHMGALRNRLIARGLIVAMQRALDRVERLRSLAGDDENITSLLDEAEQYLNITAAKEMLAEGNVTGVAHNLVKANHLINKACLLLKVKARKIIWTRMRNYLRGMEKACELIEKRIEFAKRKGINVTAIFEKLGYHNETEFREALQDMIMTARGKVEDIKEALQELREISQAFLNMNRALTRHLHQHQWQHHESWSEAGQNQNQTQSQSKAGGSGAGLEKGNSNNNATRRGRP